MISSFKYGLRPPVNWPLDAEREILLQRRLWNRLVAIEDAHRDAVEAALRRHPEYAAIAVQIDALGTEIEALYAARRDERRRARGRIETPAIDADIADRRIQRGDAYERQKAARREARALAKEELADLYDNRYAMITEARQTSGLWWANSNAVIASMDATLRRLQPGQRPRPVDEADDDSGRLTVQIQRGCPAEAFLTGGRSEARIEPGDNPARQEFRRLVATVRSEGPGTRQMATWPLIYDRPFPPQAIIKSLTISRRRTSPSTGLRGWVWSVAFQVEIPEPEHRLGGEACGIDIGWRRLEDGVRIATMVGDAGGIDHVMLPAAWIAKRERLAEMNSTLRLEARGIDLPQGIDQALREEIRQLANALQALPKEARGPARDWLDGYKNMRQHHGRLERQRLDIYRVAAAKIVRQHGMIAIDKGGIARMALDRSMPPPVRRMRTWCAPYEFAQALINAARREGVPVHEITGASTLVCHRCGHRNKPAAAARFDLIWRCEGCRAIWDQDENAARNVLAAALSASAAEALGPIPLKAARFKPPRMTRKGQRSKNGSEPIDQPAPK